MCGILGIHNLKEPRPFNVDSLKSMTLSLDHRGPDETGAYIDNYTALGHSRLSIIDLSTGSQPITNEDSTLWIIFNGEIFNYPELRDGLISRGHKFSTTTDTEVILHLFEEKREKCLKDLNGQFAIAIWDSKNKELFLARDRVGILPLYYTISNDRLIFASEIKAIFSDKDVEKKISKQGLNQIFSMWTTLPGETVFQDIFELPPAHYMIASAGNFSIKRYWDLPRPSLMTEEQINADQKIDEANNLLLDSIRIRLRADVPVGSYLSGGLDSSGITASIKNNFNNNLKTFGIGFEEKNFDESKFQLALASSLQTDHREVIAFNKDIGELFSKIIFYTEKPILRTAPVPLYLLSRAVRDEGFKVVLTGEGADEIFGGYNIFKETIIRKFWSRNTSSEKRPKLLKRLYPYIFKDPRLFSSLKTFFKLGIDDPNNSFFSHLVRWNNTSKIQNFLSDDYKIPHSQDQITRLAKFLPKDFDEWDYLSKAQYIEIITFMSGYLLSSQGDRMAMANSVEIRVPYLDHRIIEFMTQVPPSLKIRGMNEKFLLKKVYRDVLPDEIVRRPKNPYRAPIKKSIFSDKNEHLINMFSEDTVKSAGIFNPLKVTSLLNKMKRIDEASEVDNMAIAGIYSTQVLYNNFVKDFTIKTNTDFKFDHFYDYRNKN